MISDVTPAPCPEPEPVILQGFKSDPPVCVAAFKQSGNFILEPGIWAEGVIQGAEAATTRQNCINEVWGWLESEHAHLTEGADLD